MSATTEAPSAATLSIAASALSADLLAQLLQLGAVLVDDGPLDVDLVLSFPSIAGPGDPVSSITIREPSAGEMLMWDKLEGVAADLKAVSVIAAVPESVVQKLPARVFIRASRRIAAFLR